MQADDDIFLSYPSADRSQALALKAALEALNVRVWWDQERIEDADSIQRAIDQGLARCRVLVAWYSPAYARSRACQWELTAALLAAHAETAAVKRLWIVNPELGVDHITQLDVRDIELLNVVAADGTAQAPAALAQRIADGIKPVQGQLGDIRQMRRPTWHGYSGLGSRRFVGRLAELWQIHTALTAGRFAIVAGQAHAGAAGQAMARVQGTGGMGKSLLSEEYALRFGSFWPGGVFWLRALGVSDRPGEDPQALAQRRAAGQLSQLAAWATVTDLDPKGMELAQLRAALAHKLGARGHYLWVVDDLPACPRDELETWLPPSSNGHALITSRSRQHEALGEPVNLGILSPPDARALLTQGREVTGAGEELAVTDILRRLGGHALALDLARAAVAQLGYGAFLKRLQRDDQQALQLAAELADELPNGHERDIAATFIGSMEALGQEGRELLALVSELDSAPIRLSLIAGCRLATRGEAFDDENQMMQAQDWAVRAMTQLTHVSLADEWQIKPEETRDRVGESAIQVHSLVARVARWQGATTNAAVSTDWRSAAVSALCEELSAVTDIRNHRWLADSVAHARLLDERAHQSADDARLCAWLNRHALEQGRYASAQALAEKSLDSRRRILGPEHPDTLTSMNNLASTLYAQGDLAGAKAMQEQVLDIRRRILGPEHPDTLTCMNNLAGTLKDQGDLAGARTMQEQVLFIHRRILGAEHPNTLSCMNNLASTLQAQGDLAGAKTMQEQVLDFLRRILGPEHPDTLTCMNNLASTLWTQGDLVGAKTMQEQVLDFLRRILGPEHPATLTCMGNLASTLHTQGDLAGARSMREQVLENHRRILGPEHSDTLTSMNNLASTLQAQGDLAGAKTMQEQVLDFLRRILGPEHPATLTCMNNLASTLWTQGDLVGARNIEEQVLDIRHRTLGAEHPDTVNSLNSLVITLHQLGDDKAIQALLSAHPQTARLWLQQAQASEHSA